ncbi:hypothetical protein SCP_0214840 [Sparassis crispa]|uniref:Uncharacterized protein n=1 Tax=Sparassis crispa TaxID=139825 RepID=A0A401GDM7_9APHY|nr:hypothetical protein SCP_0214840 [Sparassis crispa]GBE80267.1 hypothetical protein SCP_0214840 [Sparassis crispa]
MDLHESEGRPTRTHEELGGRKHTPNLACSLADVNAANPVPATPSESAPKWPLNTVDDLVGLQ